jgi:hypothetical protein
VRSRPPVRSCVWLALVLAACGGPGPSRSDTPSGTEDGAIRCGDIAPADCPAAAEAAVATSFARGAILRVDLGRGVWCPTPGLLFANTTCPGGGLPPTTGGQWIGHALISFANRADQAYVNLAKDPGGIHGTLIALATPPPH